MTWSGGASFQGSRLSLDQEAALLDDETAEPWTPEEQKRLEFARHLVATGNIGEGE